MASPGHEYTLVGFSEEVDRRPLVFVEPLPASKVCSACGLVPKAIALHECGHYFCKPCYEQCLRRGDVVCPLDGEVCLEDEINWMNYKTRSVMTKKVRCWNHRNGCNVVTAAADISKHFHHECGHHSARCPKCAAEILASDVCAHLQSRCDASTEPIAAAVHARTNASQGQENLIATRSDLSICFQRIRNAVSMAMSSIQADLREIGSTMEIAVTATAPRHEEANQGSFETRILTEILTQMTIQTAKLKDQLDEFIQNAYANQQTFYNSFVEKNESFKQSITDTISSRIDQSELATQFTAFREAMGDGQRETNAELDRLAQVIDRQYDRMSDLLRSTIRSRQTRMRDSAESPEVHTDSLAPETSKIAWAKNSRAKDRQKALALLPSIIPAATTHTWAFEEYGSLMERVKYQHVPDIMLEPVHLRGYCVSVGVSFISVERVFLKCELHKGKLDRYLEWPFNLKIRFSILHPEKDQKLEYCVTPSTILLYKPMLSEPVESSDVRTIADSLIFHTAPLALRGFTDDGRMLLRLSLEDPSAD